MWGKERLVKADVDLRLYRSVHITLNFNEWGVFIVPGVSELIFFGGEAKVYISEFKCSFFWLENGLLF